MANTKTDPTTVLEHVLARCQDHLVADSRVLGLCVFGSLASGEADAFSDIDLGILVAQPQIDSILTDRDIICAPAPPLVAGPALGDPRCVYALYEVADQIVKVDYNYFSSDTVPAWLSSEARVLCDPLGVLGRLMSIITGEHQPQTTPADTFCIEMWSAVRMMRRGELLEACDILSHLRDPVLTRLLSRAHGVSFQNYRRAETLYPGDIVERLRETVARPEVDDLTRAIGRLANLYRDTMNTAGERIGPEIETTIDKILYYGGIT